MSSQKRIQIRRNDNIVDIIEKINLHSEGGDIFLECDDNQVLTNYLNLQLLVHRYRSKKLSIVTSNQTIKKIAEPIGIKCYLKNDNIEFEQAFEKTHILRHNFTFFEYLMYEMKKIFSRLLFLLDRRQRIYKNAKIIKDSNMFVLVLGLTVSFALLIFIFYFAVSKTYIYITPELSVKTVSRNLIFSEQDAKDSLDTRFSVSVKPLAVDATVEQSFNIATIDKDSTRNGYGTVEVFNELTTEQTFRPNTRFVTDEGLVFRSSDWIRVPASRTGSGEVVIGKTEATLVADVYDTNNEIIGQRGNIKADKILTIPGLKFNRDKIYAKTKQDFTGGIDPKVHVLTDEELEKFRGVMIEKLKNKTKELVKEKITSINQNNGTYYASLPIDDVYAFSSGALTVLKDAKVGDKIDEVSLRGQMSLKTYMYDKNAVLVYLKNVLNENILLGTEKLMNVNEDSIRVTNILSRSQTGPFAMKATTELDGTISYNFEDSSNNLTRKLKNLVANSTEKEATSILLNDPNISKVSVTFSPFWLTRVSNNPDNIEFIINK